MGKGGMDQATFIVMFVEAWLILGALVAVAFLGWGIDRLDEDARGAYAFRPLLIPAVLMIWPLVLWRWWVLAEGQDRVQDRYRPNRRLHGIVALALPVVLAAIVLTGFAVRQEVPAASPPERLSAP